MESLTLLQHNAGFRLDKKKSYRGTHDPVVADLSPAELWFPAEASYPAMFAENGIRGNTWEKEQTCSSVQIVDEGFRVLAQGPLVFASGVPKSGGRQETRFPSPAEDMRLLATADGELHATYVCWNREWREEDGHQLGEKSEAIHGVKDKRRCKQSFHVDTFKLDAALGPRTNRSRGAAGGADGAVASVLGVLGSSPSDSEIRARAKEKKVELPGLGSFPRQNRDVKIKNLGQFLEHQNSNNPDRVRLIDFGAVASAPRLARGPSDTTHHHSPPEAESPTTKTVLADAVVGVHRVPEDFVEDLVQHTLDIPASAKFLPAPLYGGHLHNSANPVSLPEGHRVGGIVQMNLTLAFLHEYKEVSKFPWKHYVQYFALVEGRAPYRLLRLSPPFFLPKAEGGSLPKVGSLGLVRDNPKNSTIVDPRGGPDHLPEAMQVVWSAWIDDEAAGKKLGIAYSINDCQAAVVHVKLDDVLAFLAAGKRCGATVTRRSGGLSFAEVDCDRDGGGDGLLVEDGGGPLTGAQGNQIPIASPVSKGAVAHERISESSPHPPSASTSATPSTTSASASATTMPLNFEGKPRPPFLWYREDHSPVVENTQSWHTSIERRDEKNPPAALEDSPLPQLYVHPTTLADLRTFLQPPSLNTGWLDGALLADLLAEDYINSGPSLPQQRRERAAELLRILAQHGPQHRVATFDTPTAVTRHGAIINLSQPVGGLQVLQNGGCFGDWTLERNMIPFKGIDKSVCQFWPAFPRVVTVAVQVGDSNFWHFVANSLAALAVLGEEDWAATPTVLHVTAKTEFVMQFLDLLGFGKNEVGNPFSNIQVVGWDIRADRLIVPEPGRCGMMSARQARWLRKTLLSAAMKSVHRPAAMKSDLLILLRRTKKRTVANWPAVVALAESYAVRHNLTIVEHHDEKLPSVREQIRSFGRAHTVIGPHGAANTLLVVAPVGVRVVEFHTRKNWITKTQLCYLALGLVSGARFAMIPYEADGDVAVDDLREAVRRVEAME